VSTLPSRRKRARPEKAKKNRGWLTPVLLTLLIAVVIGAGWLAQAYFLTGESKNILLMGVDEDKVRTDVLVVAHINPREKRVNLVSIPRDTLVNINCTGRKICVDPDKVNHAHAYGGKEGPALTVDTVERFLGIKIDGYVKVDFEKFAKVVDALGGVDIVIDKDMNYDDPDAKPPLHIHFQAKKEPQHLNGQKALEYVRYRGPDGDLGRIERTKRFFQAIARAAQAQGTAKLVSLTPLIKENVETNLDLQTMISLAKMGADLDLNAVKMATIPGHDEVLPKNGWVWIADKEKTQAIVNELIWEETPAAKN
jgi:LCP family protein required for cell wall assembly